MQEKQQNPFERFTKEARLALQIAENEANKASVPYIWTEHLLLWLLSIPNSIAFMILNSIWVTFELVIWVIREVWNASDKTIRENTRISTYLSKVIEDSLKIAMDNWHSFVSTEHLLYSIITNKKSAWNIVLENLSIDTDTIKSQIDWIFSKIKWWWDLNKWQLSWTQWIPKSFEDMMSNLAWVVIWAVWWWQWNTKWFFWSFWFADQWKTKEQKEWKWKNNSKTPALDYFSKDITKMAKENKLDPVIWRDQEINRVVNTLNRKTKNNPILLWEAWVWKTAIAEWLAQRIVEWNVPIWLLNKKVLNLDLSEIIAWTKYRWEFEERMKDIIDEAVSEENDIILFIDEIHTIIWLWSAEWTLDTANILKPALARWMIQIIWATTLDEYRKYIEKDKALERRFQKVIVEEPNDEDAIKILMWLKKTYENYHNIEITEDAIKTAVNLSRRYIADRFLPDKAIDLIDEASAKKWWKAILNTKEKEEIEKQISNNEKLREKAVSEQNYDRALFLKKKDEELREKLYKLLHPKFEKKIWIIDYSDITEVLSEITWISSLKINKSETQKIKNLSQALWNKIINQDEAINQITKSIMRNRAWIWSYNRPIWSFLLLWPTWVWKTETVKRLAEEMYESKEALIKIDMSEFSERHNVSRLIWATAWYVWYEEWWQLTEAVRRKPYSIVLFDEVEKAHNESFNILLQILEDWVLTDAKWRKIDFKNTIIVLTSNIWADILTQEAKSIWFETDEKKQLKDAVDWFESKKEQVLEEVKEYFLPELLNRIDKIIVFNPLDKKSIKKIVKLNIEDLGLRLKSKWLSIDISEVILSDIANISYNPEDWARRVRKVIQETIEEPLSEKILNEEFQSWDTIKIIRKNWKKEEFEILKKNKS